MRAHVIWLSQSRGKRRWRVYVAGHCVLSVPLRRVDWMRDRRDEAEGWALLDYRDDAMRWAVRREQELRRERMRWSGEGWARA